MNNLDRVLFGFFVLTIVFFGGILTPLLCFSLLLILSIIYKGRGTFFLLVISVSMLCSLLSISINPNGNNIGDVVVYYRAFIDGDFLDTLINLKIYRYLVFHLQYLFGLPVKFYSFISIFLIFSLYSLFYRNFLKYFNCKILNIRDKLLFLIVLFSAIPLFVVSSFENTLSFVFFANGLVLSFQKNSRVYILWFIASVLTHSSSIIFILILFISKNLKNVNRTILYIVSCLLLVFIYNLVYFHKYINIPLLGFYLSRLNYYITGPWSVYVGNLEYFLLFFAFFKMYMILIFSEYVRKSHDKSQYKIVIDFLSMYFVFCILFVSSRTLNLRYIYIGFLLISPFIYLAGFSMNSRFKTKLIVIFYSFISIFSLHNLYYVKGLLDTSSFAPSNGVFSSIPDFINSEFDLPQGKYIFQSRTEKVESNP